MGQLKRKEARAQSNTRKKGAVKRKNKAARKKTREQRQHQGLRERAHERKEELQQKANEETQVRGRPVRRGDIFKVVGLAAFMTRGSCRWSQPRICGRLGVLGGACNS